MAVVLPKTQSEIYYERFRAVFRDDFPTIDVEYIFYGDYKESPELLRDRQKNFDAIIFAGAAAYYYTEGNLPQETTWLHLPREAGSIYRALLLARDRGWDITRLTFDTFEHDMILETYRELGYSEDRLRIQCYSGNLRNPDYNRQVFNFHRELLARGVVSGCVTRLTTVANMMKDSNIPYIFAHPTIDTFREQVSFARELAIAKENGSGQFAVISVDIAVPEDFSFVVAGSYSVALDRLNMARRIYSFANLIRGAVTEQGVSQFMIYTTMDVLEAQTKYYQHFQFFDRLVKDVPYAVSIGVGCGESLLEAQRLSGIAVRKCMKTRKSCGLVQFADGTALRIKPGEADSSADSSAMAQWQVVARKTGVSVSTIYRIAELMHRQETDCFTAQELAEGLSISRRSADRLLEKLETNGYAAVTGKEMLSKKGRPARVTRLFLNN